MIRRSLVHGTSVGEAELGGPFAMILCESEFQGRVNHSGSGYIINQFIPAPGQTCSSGSAPPCNEAGVKDRWPAGVETETTMEVTFCVRPFNLFESTCHIVLNVDDKNHSGVVVSTTNGSLHQPCENDASLSLQGTWKGEVGAGTGEVPIEGID